jgi:N-acetylmuramoyl-L-alanine amidase
MAPVARSAQSNRRLATTIIVIAVAVTITAWRLDAPAAGSSSKAGLRPGETAVDPGAFASGACMAFAPTSGNRHKTVFLDAGHGGIDPGAVGTTDSGQTIYEADVTLPVELDTAALLRADGFRVIVSRTADTTVAKMDAADESGGAMTLQGAHDDVAARDVCADKAGASALVGIYMDAGGSPSNAGSIAAYDTDRPFWQKSLELATLVENDVLAQMNSRGWAIPDDGVVPDSTLGSYVGSPDDGGIAAEAASYDHLLLLGPAEAGFFSKPSDMPGTVLEPLFITDPFEGSIAASTAGQMAIASGISQGVEQFLAPATAGRNSSGRS